MYAARWFAAIRRAHPDLDARITAGEPGIAFDWLDEHVWRHGNRWTTAELVARASGGPRDPQFFRNHLEQRDLGR